MSPAMPNTLVGLTLENVRVYERTMVVSLKGPAGEVHLICEPEGKVDLPPDGDLTKAKVTMTGMKYEIATGPLTTPPGALQLSGLGAEVLRREITNASHDPERGLFALGLARLSVVISPYSGLQILKTTEIPVEFRPAFSLP